MSTSFYYLMCCSVADAVMDVPPFYFGSHYSNSAIVLYYLMRRQPFTRQYLDHNGGVFDLPDRQFTSIKRAWDLSLNTMARVFSKLPFCYCFLLLLFVFLFIHLFIFY